MMYVYRLCMAATMITIWPDFDEPAVSSGGDGPFRNGCLSLPLGYDCPGREAPLVAYLERDHVFGVEKIEQLHLWFDDIWDRVLGSDIPLRIVRYKVPKLTRQFDTQVIFHKTAAIEEAQWLVKEIPVRNGIPQFEHLEDAVTERRVA